ncbi:hypothetical protein EW026_g1668 [Hermanssonia centrifuga]|uniref:Uncharacterized protein n=1 Tax=Hermanssonia centrifuga TaxID=98765 RepID=A0A4S4KQR0_9APHY|nr:hypothetical protein EW026_g1668 [Hermanssonia centrifuga]
MDRMVKIWRMPQIDHAKVKIDSEHLAREDKPLFSTDLIHNARVLSIAWLTDDTLVSYSAPALMGNPATEDFWKEPGTVAIWTWLGFDRYLPRGMLAPMMRGNQNVSVAYNYAGLTSDLLSGLSEQQIIQVDICIYLTHVEPHATFLHAILQGS